MPVATELWSRWGRLFGWQYQRGDAYGVSAELDGTNVYYYSNDLRTVKRIFHRACRRTVLRRYFPFIAPPPVEVSITFETVAVNQGSEE